MTLKDKAERAAVSATLDTLLKYVDKNPEENYERRRAENACRKL